MDEILAEAAKKLREIADALESGKGVALEISTQVQCFGGVERSVEAMTGDARARVTWRHY